MYACFDPGVRFSRIITPAFAQPSVFDTSATRATIDPSPLIVWYTKWKWSVGSQMSLPPDVIVHVPLDSSSAALPTTIGFVPVPTSRLCHGAGSADAAVVTFTTALDASPAVPVEITRY